MATRTARTVVITYNTGVVNITRASHPKLFADLVYRFARSQDTLHLTVTGEQAAVDRLLRNKRLAYQRSQWEGYLESKRNVSKSIAVLELLIQLLPRPKSLYWLWIKNLYDLQSHTLTPALETYLWNSSCRPTSLKMKHLKIKTGDIAKFVDYLEHRLSIIPLMKDGTPLKTASYALYLFEALTQWYDDFLYNLDSAKDPSAVLGYFEHQGYTAREVQCDGRTKIIYPPLIYWISNVVPTSDFYTFGPDWTIISGSGLNSPWYDLHKFHVKMDEHINNRISSDAALVDQCLQNAGEDVQMDVVLSAVQNDTPLLAADGVNTDSMCSLGSCGRQIHHLSQAAFMLMLQQWFCVLAHHPRSQWAALTTQWRSCSAVDSYITQCVGWVERNLQCSDQHRAFAVFAHELGYWNPKICHKTKHDCLNSYPQSVSSYELDDHMFTYHAGDRG